MTITMAIANLPGEIIERIAYYLDTSDLIECVCASSEWNVAFRPIRYKSVEVDSYSKYSIFVETVKESVTANRHRSVTNIPRLTRLGQYVRSINTTDGIMTIKAIKELGSLCPDLKSINFSWRKQQQRSLKDEKLRRTFGDPLPFIENLGANLTCLTLGGGKVDTYSLLGLIDVLQHLPQLESTTLEMTINDAKLEHLEKIHTLCPRLKVLDFKKPLIDLTYDDASIIDIESIMPVPGMESLSLKSKAWADWRICTSPLFKYIVRKYPQLKVLDINSAMYHERYNGDYYGYGVSWDDQPLSPEAPFTVLRNYFPQLEEVYLGRFAGRPVTIWPQLITGIPRISLQYDYRDRDTLSDWIKEHATENITQLRIAMPKCLDDLKQYPNLTIFTLDSPRSWKWRMASITELPIDVVLQVCPGLIELTAYEYLIHYTSTNKGTGFSPLKKLVLRDSVLASNTVFTRLSANCPDLKHLDLQGCRWCNAEENPVIMIHMPKRHLTYVRLYSLQICEETPQLRSFLRSNPTATSPYVTQKLDKVLFNVYGSEDFLLLDSPKHVIDDQVSVYYSHGSINKDRMSASLLRNLLNYDEEKKRTPEILFDPSTPQSARLRRSTSFTIILRCNDVDRIDYDYVKLYKRSL